MELWIRSQDKVVLEKVERILANDNYIETKLSILGNYKTKERALEVLDDIQRAIILDYKSDFGMNDGTPITFNKNTDTIVYEMPKD